MAGRGVGVRARRRPQPAPPHPDDVVDPGGDAHGVRGEPRPRRELVDGEAQTDDAVVADGRAHRREGLAQQQVPRGAPAVGPVVGQWGEELTQQGVLAGLDLHAAQPRVPRRAGGRREPGDDRGDRRVGHRDRHLAGHGIGDADGAQSGRRWYAELPWAPAWPSPASTSVPCAWHARPIAAHPGAAPASAASVARGARS